MNKLEFIEALRQRLSGLPQREVEERLGFYSEMIDDRMEDGLSEEAAVADMGAVETVADQILADIPLSKIAKETIKPQKKLAGWEIALIIVSFPVWLPLLIAAFAVIISIYAVIWSLIIAFWSIFATFIGCTVAGVVSGILFIVLTHEVSGLAMIGAAFVLAGLSILCFFACKQATLGVVQLTHKIALGIKKLFIKKEVA